MAETISASSAADRAVIQEWRDAIENAARTATAVLGIGALTLPEGDALDIFDRLDPATRRQQVGLLIRDYRDMAKMALATANAGKTGLALADLHLTVATRSAHALNEMQGFVAGLDLPAHTARVRELEVLVDVMQEKIVLQELALKNADALIGWLSKGGSASPEMAAFLGHIAGNA